MSTDYDIFYQVKKQILDKLDLILQKVNLEIINSRHLHSMDIEEDSDFTFIELSQFEFQITALFAYLDKLYDSLNSSVSGYTTQGHYSANIYSQLQMSNDKLQAQNQSLKKEQERNIKQLQRLAEQIKKQKQEQSQIVQSFQILQKQRQRMLEQLKSFKKTKQKIAELSSYLEFLPKQISLLKKWIGGKLKEYKFDMLETRVEILTTVKETESYWRQLQRSTKINNQPKDKKPENIEKQPQIHCHHIDHDSIQIINELNQILKMC